MYEYFERVNGYGGAGIILTVFVYIILTFVNLSLLYYYLIFIHMGGRVIDIYQRLSGNVQHFFLPHDNEVSLNYLKWVCAKALRFNHRVEYSKREVMDENSNIQKVHFVHVYKFNKETHEIYFYRSFVRDYDGAIKETAIINSVITDELKDGLVQNRPGLERYYRDQHYNLSEDKEEEKKEEEDDEDEPLKKSMDSKFLLREDLNSHRSSHNDPQSDYHDDALISNQIESSRHRDEEEEDNIPDSDEYSR